MALRMLLSSIPRSAIEGGRRRATTEGPVVADVSPDVTRQVGVASRITAVLPISEEAVSFYQPLVLPLSIGVLGLLRGGCPPSTATAQGATGECGQAQAAAPQGLAACAVAVDQRGTAAAPLT
jgi:hypothetical protein